MNILVFGDSIVYGECTPATDCWVNRLRMYLDKKYDYKSYVHSLGISGHVSEEILTRFDSECKPRHRPERDGKTVIIFGIGINDTQDLDGQDRTSIEDFKKNIGALITKAKKFTDEITFVGLTPVDEPKVKNRFSSSTKQYKSYFNEKIIKYDNAIGQICRGQQVQYIYIFDLFTSKDLADGLHPNSEGHEKIFKRVLEELKL